MPRKSERGVFAWLVGRSRWHVAFVGVADCKQSVLIIAAVVEWRRSGSAFSTVALDAENLKQSLGSLTAVNADAMAPFHFVRGPVFAVDVVDGEAR